MVLVVVWDRAPFHRPKLLQRDNMTIIFLPSYSPQLNPVDIRLSGNNEALKKLTGYEWIIEQWSRIVK